MDFDEEENEVPVIELSLFVLTGLKEDEKSLEIFGDSPSARLSESIAVEFEVRCRLDGVCVRFEDSIVTFAATFAVVELT